MVSAARDGGLLAGLRRQNRAGRVMNHISSSPGKAARPLLTPRQVEI